MKTRLFMWLLLLVAAGCKVTGTSETEQQAKFLEQMSSSSVKELQRVTNPTGLVDAVLCERETNATVATPTEVYLVKKGTMVLGAPIFRADRVEGVTINWLSNCHLKISAKQARRFFSTTTSSIEVANGSRFQGKIEFSIEKEL